MHVPLVSEVRRMCGLYLYVLDVCLTRASDASLGGCSRETEQKTEFQGKQNRNQSFKGNRTENRVSGESEQKSQFQGKQNRKQSFRGNRTENRVSKQKSEFQGSLGKQRDGYTSEMPYTVST